MTAVLFTCAGQRVDIVTAFRRAGATTIATDVNQLAPALYHADRRALVPRVDDPAYVDALRDLVALHDVRLIVPLTDLDHLVLAEARDRLRGAVVLVPEPETIRRCSDKYLAHEFFDAAEIGSPRTTFQSCGSSSRLRLRRIRPLRVIRASPLSTASPAPCFSAPTTIVRSFSSSKSTPPRPTRACL